MEKRNEDGSARDSASPFDRMFDEIAGFVWEDALRFALDLDRASERCGRRSCRKAGACRLKWTEGRPVACGGGEVSYETIRTAGAAAWFGALMVMRCLHAPASSRTV